MNNFIFIKIQYIYQLFCLTCFTKHSIPIFDIPCHLQLLCIYTMGGSNHLLSIFILLHPWCCISRHISHAPCIKTQHLQHLFGANLTKVSFGNGGHYFATITSLSHLCCVLAQVQLTTFWSFRLCTAMAFPKMQTFILSWCWWQGPLSKIKGLQGLAIFITKPCTSFKCLVDNHLA